MKAIELLEKVREKPVFRVQDIERIAGIKRSYAKLTLNRLKKRGLIKQVGRNAYTTKDNIFVIASNITYPSYISFWSASSFLGYTEQILNTVQVAATRRMSTIRFGGYTIKFIPLKDFFGYRKTMTNDGELFIAENEKLLIDAFLKPKECGNFDEIRKIFEGADISEERVIDYLKRTGSQTAIKRVGFLLEKTKGKDISGSFEPDRNYVVLNPFSKKWGTIDGKWRVKI
ncbi:MAG: type IV toxin-antitoxin system AbiEi family antitoxin domain-containing protein [Candidatus Aenigmarchaeota archaeon]|nr:type IV toxin-antitoxin system AbiEi family antitoxin domain-containing protein [Candidatus Aenigmarchaeota archaeon]